MATTSVASTTPKLTPTQLRKTVDSLNEKIELLTKGAWCSLCDRHLPKYKFYTSTDPRNKSGVTPVCKECARKIALKIGDDGVEHDPDKASVNLALRYLNKPYKEDVWDASVLESSNTLSGKIKENPWNSYVKNIAMRQYNGLTYVDSDIIGGISSGNIGQETTIINNSDSYNSEMMESFAQNKKDVIKLLGYDPFVEESIIDQPFLYSQLLGILDSSEDSNEDMIRTASAVSIVRNFLQQSKIDNTISKLMSDSENIEKGSGTIKSLQDSKAKISSNISTLSKDSCISLQYNKNSKKGENTWTGKIKKIKNLNLRESEVNGFDIGTCRGMQQVQEISDASIMKQLALDESEWSDMVAEMRVANVDLRRERDAYQEINRILLRENLDLRDTLKENQLLDEENVQDLRDIYSVFAEFDNQKEGNDEDYEDEEVSDYESGGDQDEDE